jgi:hypothetical protein
MDITEIRWEVVVCIHLALDRGQWQSRMNTVMNLRVQLMADSIFTEWLLPYREGLCSMELVEKKSLNK